MSRDREVKEHTAENWADSPSPRSDRAPFNGDDESEHSLVSLWNPIKPLHKFLSVLVVSLVLAALGFSSLPLWRPIGALVLQKLWDVLRFLVLTTSIGLGILNSRLWRGDSAASNSGKEDSSSSKVPFVGMFYGEVQHSYSFSDKEMEAREYGSTISRSESERDAGHDTNAATSTDRKHAASAATSTDGHHENESSLRANSDDQLSTQHATMLVTGPTSAVSTRRGAAHERDGIRANGTHHNKEDGAINEEVPANPYIHMRRNAVNVATIGKNRLVKPYDDLGLAAVAEDPKQSSSKIIHRSSSLEFPIAQEWGTSVYGNDAAPHHQMAAQEKLSSSEKAASSTVFNAASHVNKKGIEPSSSVPAARRAEKHSNIGAGIPGAASKHSRSQSAYDLNELLVQQQRPRSKPDTSSQLPRRRNVSLSCDLDKEYSNVGMPAWLSSLPSPPEPPLIYAYDGAENRVEVAESKQDESSRRKAFTESLAPWRAATNTVPVSIPTFTHKESTQSHKDPSTKQKKMSTLEKQMVSTPPSSPSTPNTMGSPSPGELNKKVDAFIARFHQRMRLQRLESFERSKQRDL